jgi:membrane-associated phospholipid phosphatase
MLADSARTSDDSLPIQQGPGSFIELHFTAALVALGIAIILFALIAADVVTGGAGTLIDARLSIWLHAHTTARLTTFFALISKLHSSLYVGIVIALICTYLWTKHLRYWVLSLLLSVCGGMLLNVALKDLFVRPRPSFSDTIPRLHTFSFPSGHTMVASVFYGSLCVLLVSRTQSWILRALAIVVAFLMIALVGFSRMYLGVHYLMDVMGAIAEGSAWLTTSFLIVALVRKHRALSSHLS